MRTGILVSIFMCLLAPAMGQTGKLTGMVYDSLARTPLEYATVTVYNPDSSLVTFQLANKDGIVSFEKLPLKRKIRVSASFVGYNTLHSMVQLEGKDTLRFFLSLQANDTSSVVVKSVIPIRMNGDTLEINPAAFKMKEHQVVEELLNQVPGITIWSDGTITQGGRKVQNVFVDGKPFIGSTDPRIATQNLPKSAIDKIQLYEEYNRENINNALKMPSDSVLTMNIKLKESAKKGYFGKSSAGYGTDNRAEADLIMQVYDKKNSLAFGGGYNNINKDIGAISQLLQNNTFRTTNPDLYRVGRFGGSGITDAHSAGTMFTHNFGESNNSRQNNRLIVTYNENGATDVSTSQSLQDRIGLGDEQIVNDQSRQNSGFETHTLNLNYTKTNSYEDNMAAAGSVSLQHGHSSSAQSTEIRDPAGFLQSTNNSYSQVASHSDGESFNINFAKNDGERPLANLGFTGRINRSHSGSENKVTSAFQSFTVAGANTSYNRIYTDVGESVSGNANLNYGGFKRLVFGRYNFFNINVSLTQDFDFSQNSNHYVVSDYDSSSKKYVLNTTLTNDNIKKTTEYIPTLSLSKAFSKARNGRSRSIGLQGSLTGNIRTENNASSIAQRNLDRTFRNLRFSASANYFLYKVQKFMIGSFLSYSKNYDYPSIDALYTIVDSLNVYSITVGNPYLKRTSIHNMNASVNFNTQNSQSPYSINSGITAGYMISENPVGDSVINTPAGKRFSYYINTSQSNHLNVTYNLRIAKRIRKNSLQLTVNGRYNAGMRPNYIDRIYNLSRNSNISGQLGIWLMSSKMAFGATERLEFNHVNQTYNTATDFRNNSSTASFSFNLNFTESFNIGSTLDYVKTSTLDKSTSLWNAFATKRLMHQQAEIKFSALDILRQYVNIYTSAGQYGTTTTVTNGLQQFFMLTFGYYPRKFGKRAGERD